MSGDAAVPFVKKALRGLLMLAVGLCLFIYAWFGMAAALRLAAAYHYSQQDISAVTKLVNNPQLGENPAKVRDWLMARPLAETPALIKTLTPLSGKLDYNTFFELYRREARRGNMEDALFWEELGLFRQRYDIVRCDLKSETERLIAKSLNKEQPEDIQKYLRGHPDRLIKALRRLLDFDAQYPAANDPTVLCRSFNPKAAPDLWGGYRPGMRQQVEKYIQKLEKTPVEPDSEIDAGPDAGPGAE